MPLLFCLAQHAALRAVADQMEEGEHLFAFLDDLYIICRLIELGRFTPSSNGSCFATPTSASTWARQRYGTEVATSQRHAHDCKRLLQWWTSQLWSGEGITPPSLVLRSQNPRVSSGPPGLRQCSAAGEVRSHSVLSLRWRISKPRGCCCCSVRKPRPISFSGLSTLIRHSSMQRDTTIVVHSRSHHCPSQWEDWGCTVLVRHAAYWSSWADCVHMVNKRHPQICRSILRSIVTDNPPHHIEGVSISEAALRLSGFHPPSWEELADGLRPGRRAIEDEDRTQPRFGWQKLAAESLQLDFRENVLMPSLPVEKRALLRSQSGPFSSTPFVAFPTTKVTTFDPQPFRVLMLRRVHLPLHLSTRNCRCGRPLDSLGYHRAACAVAGVLGRRGFPLESAAARVCREAGARVRTNVMVRDLDLWPPHRIDNRRLEVVADGLPLHGGAQLAIDTTWCQP